MRTNRFIASGGLMALTVLLPLPLSDRGKASTARGTYKEWNGEIDHLTILQPFRLTDYKRMVVMPLETQNVELPDEDDNTYAPVITVLATSTATFTEDLRSKLTGRLAVDNGGKSAPKGPTLVLRCRVAKMDPGSQAGRFFGKLPGAIASAAATRIVGDVLEGANNKVLLQFKQERRSGVGAFGGDYEELIRRNLHAIAADVASILKAF